MNIPATRAEALANIATDVLIGRGQALVPSLHEISRAVVESAPLLHLNGDEHAVEIEDAAVKIVCERHKWTDTRVVVVGPWHKQRGWGS